MNKMIVGRNITKSFKNVDVLKGVDINILQGEVVSIVGASGAGKSTLLQILGTLEKPNSGQVEIAGTEISLLSDREISKFRNRNIGFVFQFHHLLPEFNALENVCIPAYINGTIRVEAEKRATELLDFMGLGHRLQHKPAELSGGEQQRVAIARALINQPAVVMADEPTGNLDSENAGEIHKLFFKLRDEFRQTFLIVTHNQQLAAMADRTLVMKDGAFV
jgi:lipoprotein-releasing system ATP-binding protein